MSSTPDQQQLFEQLRQLPADKIQLLFSTVGLTSTCFPATTHSNEQSEPIPTPANSKRLTSMSEATNVSPTTINRSSVDKSTPVLKLTAQSKLTSSTEQMLKDQAMSKRDIPNKPKKRTKEPSVEVLSTTPTVAKCSTCNKEFANNKCLKIHISRVHSAPKLSKPIELRPTSLSPPRKSPKISSRPSSSLSHTSTERFSTTTSPPPNPLKSPTTIEPDTDEAEQEVRIQQFLNQVITPEGLLDDLTGLEGAKEELWGAVIFQKELTSLWTPALQLKCGILLHGPPACGKTTLAIKAAAQANLKMLKITASEVSSIYTGGACLRMSALFEAAIRCSPCLLFLDEVDSLVASRDGEQFVNCERLTTFLDRMSTLYRNSKNTVIVMAATNHIEKIDQAARSRFAFEIFIPKPTIPIKIEFLKKQFKTLQHPTDLSKEDWDEFSQEVNDLDFRQLTELVRKSALRPIKELRKSYTIQQIRQMFNEPIPVTRTHLIDAAKEFKLISEVHLLTSQSPKAQIMTKPTTPSFKAAGKDMKLMENLRDEMLEGEMDDDNHDGVSVSSRTTLGSTQSSSRSNSLSCPLCQKKVGSANNAFNLANHLHYNHKGFMAPALEVLSEAVLTLTHRLQTKKSNH